MRILILARGYPTEDEPQDGIFEFDQAKALQKYGHEVVVLNVDTRVKKKWRKPGVSHIIKDGISVVTVYYFPTSIIRRISYRLSSYLEQCFVLKGYKYIIEEFGGIDLIHAHYLPCASQAIAIKNRHQVKIIATEHWSELNKEPISKYVNYLGQRVYKNVDKLVTVCQPLQQRINHLFGVDSVVIHNMVDTMFETPYVPQAKQESDPFLFLMVGSILYGKGIDILVEAYNQSHLKDYNVQVKVIGSFSRYVHTLQNKIKEYNLEDKITISHAIPKSEIYGELKKADAFVLPSRSENFSVAILEALAAGLPVIATITGGVRESINESNGILVPVEDTESLSRAMEYMYHNVNKYNKVEIRENCLSQFSAEAIARKLSEQYMLMF